MAIGWFIRTVNPKPIALAGANSRNVNVPHVAGVFREPDAGLLSVPVVALEQTDFDSGSVVRGDGKIDAAAVPRGAERIRSAGKGFLGFSWTLSEAIAFATRQVLVVANVTKNHPTKVSAKPARHRYASASRSRRFLARLF